jgi:hypothetical protein
MIDRCAAGLRVTSGQQNASVVQQGGCGEAESIQLRTPTGTNAPELGSKISIGACAYCRATRTTAPLVMVLGLSASWPKPPG